MHWTALLLAAGQADVRLVRERMALDDVNEAFAAMERQEGIRSVLTFD
jgi:Zn-dependent alcohol dehydrogenase